MTDMKWNEVYGSVLARLYRDGKPDANNTPIDTLLLADISLSLRKLVMLGEQGMKLNLHMMQQLDKEYESEARPTLD